MTFLRSLQATFIRRLAAWACAFYLLFSIEIERFRRDRTDKAKYQDFEPCRFWQQAMTKT